jgi:hypothetical protein
MLFLFVQPDVGAWSRPLEIASYLFIFSLGGLGGLVAILLRAGVVEFCYSEADRHTLTYRLSRHVADQERGIWGSTFSRRYFESFEREGRHSDDSKH